MKKLAAISKVSEILFPAMLLPFSAQSQDIQTPTHSRSADQSRLTISEQLLAYHDLKKDSQSEEDMEIIDVLIFIYESVEKRTLAGKGSGRRKCLDHLKRAAGYQGLFKKTRTNLFRKWPKTN